MHFDNEDRHGTTPRLLRRLDDRFYVIEWFGKPAKTYSLRVSHLSHSSDCYITLTCDRPSKDLESEQIHIPRNLDLLAFPTSYFYQ